MRVVQDLLKNSSLNFTTINFLILRSLFCYSEGSTGKYHARLKVLENTAATVMHLALSNSAM